MAPQTIINRLDSYNTISFLASVKSALDRFPRLRSPIERARLLGRPSYPIYYRQSATRELKSTKAKRVKRELLEAGMTLYGLLKSESRYLPKIIHDFEHIEAMIYGQHNASSAMLIATDERIIYLDKKPMVEMFDEVSYDVVSGIEFDIHSFFATVVLHTPVRNYEFRFVNLRCAEKFARHIEKHRLEREPKLHQPVIDIEPPAIVTDHELNDMAGYYWLPADEEERRKLQQVIT